MRDVVGNEHAQALLERALASGQTSHAYLFTGPEGVGKTALALAFAQALLCERRAPGESAACGECRSCRQVASRNHPDLTLIEPLVKDGKQKFWITINQLREAEHLASLAPMEASRRVFIIPTMRRIKEESANTLLKTLEEPPATVTLILIASEPGEVLPTIVSRCQLVQLYPLTPEVIAKTLRERWGVAAADASRLAGLSIGRMGWALRARTDPQVAREREEALTAIATLPGLRLDERMRLAAGLGADNASARQTLDLWALWWRDVTLAASGANRLLTTGEPRAIAERLGRAIGSERARRFLETLLAAEETLDVNANPRLTMENLALDLPSAR